MGKLCTKRLFTERILNTLWINDIEEELKEHKQLLKRHEEKIDFFVRSSLPPVEGIFFEGQVFDAYSFVASLIRKARQRIVLIDNYIDDTVLTLLDKSYRSIVERPREEMVWVHTNGTH